MNNLINSILSKFNVDNLSCNLRRDKVDDWINILDNTEYSSTKYCNSFIEFTLEIFNKKNLIDLSLIVYENKKPVSIIPFFYDETKKIFFYERYKFDANTIIEPIFSNKCNNKTKNKIYEIFFSILTNKIDYILFSTTFCNNFQAPYWYLNRFDDCKLYEKKNFLYLDLEMLDSIKKKLKLPKIANKNRINILYKKNDKQIWNQIKNLHKKMHGSTRSLKSWELQKNSIDAGDGLLSYILDDKNNVSAANFFYITRDESRYAMSVSAENLANYCGAHLNISSLEFIKKLGIKWHFLGSSKLDFLKTDLKKINIAKFKEKFSSTVILDYHYKIY